MKHFKYLIVAVLLFVSGSVQAAPVTQFFTNVAPFITNTYDNGTSTNVWKNIWTNGLHMPLQADGCGQFSSGNFTSTGSPCGSGGGAGTGTVSTSTPLVAGQVDFSTSASTIGNDATFLFDSILKKLTFTYGSSTTFTVSGTSYLGTIGSGVGTGLTGTAASLTAGLATALANGRTIGITGDLTYTSPSFDGTGNVTAAGTLATVNSNVGTFGSSTAIPTFTVNGKGLITAASTNVVIAPAGTLTGTTLASNVVTSSLTSVGTIATGVWNGTKIDVLRGGTNATTFSPNSIVVSDSLGTTLIATGTQLTVGNLLATTTATSTFAGGIATAKALDVQGTASSTFANGIQLSAGCFRMPSGSCITAGAGGTPGGSNKQVQFNDSGSFGADADFIWDKTSNTLSLSGNPTIGSDSDLTIFPDGLLNLNSSGSLNLYAGTGLYYFEQGSGDGKNAIFNVSGLTTTRNIIVPDADGTLCLTTTCTGSFPFTPTTYSGFNVVSTSTPVWFKGTSPFSLIASSTFATNASSTLFTNSGATWLTGLIGGAGGVGIDANGKLYSGATSTLTTISGILPIASGGTNTTSQTTNGVNYFDGTKITSGSQMVLNNSLLGVGTTTPRYTVQIASTTAPQLVLTGNDTDPGIAIRSIGGHEYHASTSPTTFATSSIAAIDFNYNAGVTPGFNIGTSTTSTYPVTLSATSNSNTIDVFALATTTGAQIGGYDGDGHRFTSGYAPAISTCGTGSPTVVGDDQTGTITTGTAATACTMTFAKAYQKTPVCNFNDDSSTIPGDISAISTTAVTFALGAGLSGGHLYYSCSYHR